MEYPLAFQFSDSEELVWRSGSVREANFLLSTHHYLGPVLNGKVVLTHIGEIQGSIVAAQVWKLPTSRRLPNDGTWLELARWCLTPEAGTNAGSRQHKHASSLLKALGVSTLISYSDPSQGHTGSLYRACNWIWAPTWHRLRPPPTGNGNWGTEQAQSVKDRWIFHISARDTRRDQLICSNESAIKLSS